MPNREILKLYKNLGETPLECLQRFKAEHPEYAETKMTYLGRLDPMAEGLLLVLAGDMRSKQEYLSLDKTYEFEVLWGFSSDTYDILGLITETGKTPPKLEWKMESLLKKILGKKTQRFPVFSSKNFKGNFLTARDQKIEGLDTTEKGIKIFSLKHIHTRLVTSYEVRGEVINKISLVKGDFRQKEIIRKWNKELGKLNNETFLISRFTADVSSGTYIRSLADEMGKILDTVALAWSIKRTRVGKFRI